jgi:hypothetical protein
MINNYIYKIIVELFLRKQIVIEMYFPSDI